MALRLSGLRLLTSDLWPLIPGWRFAYPGYDCYVCFRGDNGTFVWRIRFLRDFALSREMGKV